jgi:uncharacterized protein (TIGR02646 family)
VRIRRGPDPGPFGHFSDYKPHLRRLFRRRCAYCLVPDHYLGRLNGMTVDHFQPRDRYDHLLHVWTNLYYSCGICNEHYKKNRPTEEEELRGLRLVDPCRQDPINHFGMRRDPTRMGHRCLVRARTARGRFTLSVLKYNYRDGLIEHWRELELDEMAAREDVLEAKRLLRAARVQMQQHPSAEMSEIVDGLEKKWRRAKQTLRRFRRMWPFPLI